jgi:hypothetical protein
MAVTPGQPLPDISPVKDDDPRSNGLNRHVMSSSPPPMDGVMGSPSKPARGSQMLNSSSSSVKHESTPGLLQRENGASAENEARFDRNAAGAAPIRFNSEPSANTIENHNDDDDDGEGGFDLAKGFAPIAGGSFPSQRSSSVRAGS